MPSQNELQVVPGSVLNLMSSNVIVFFLCICKHFGLTSDTWDGAHYISPEHYYYYFQITL